MALLPGSKALLFASGGGGDIASAALLKYLLNDVYNSILLGSIPWERFKYDPKPGPIKYEEVRNGVVRDGYMIVSGDSYAIRDGREVFFQAAKVARFLDEEVFIVSPIYGFKSFVKGIRNVMVDYGLDTFIAVDVGGDILCRGDEDELWSPMADAYGLAAAYQLSLDGFNSMVAVVSPGSDGELPWNYLRKRLHELYIEGSIIRVIGFGSGDTEFYSELLKYVDTEASRLAYDALVNGFGERRIRGGSRHLELGIHSTLTFFIDPNPIYRDSLPSHVIIESDSFEESNMKLIENGVPTEYELEKLIFDLSRFYVDEKELYTIARNKLMEYIKRRRH